MVEYIIFVIIYSLSIFLVYYYTKKKYKVVNLTEINSLLSEILETNFKNSSLSNAAESILIVLKRFYKIDYITILIYHENTKELDVIASNIGSMYVKPIEKYASSLLKSVRGRAGKVLCSDGSCLNYPTARERGISFSSFTPLLHQNKLIGAVLLENKTGDDLTKDAVRMELYDKVFNSTALVLQNVLNTESLIKMTSTDQLTGVHNRRFIDMTLPEQLSIHRNLGMSFSVAMFDIDHFKKFNDTYGHQFGDLVLKDVATYIKESLGENEWIARYGGEEFLIFFGRSNPEKVYYKVEVLRQGLEDLKVTDGQTTASVTASFGVATFPKINGNATDIVEKADDALYKSKRNGRNRVTIS